MSWQNDILVFSINLLFQVGVGGLKWCPGRGVPNIPYPWKYFEKSLKLHRLLNKYPQIPGTSASLYP